MLERRGKGPVRHESWGLAPRPAASRRIAARMVPMSIMPNADGRPKQTLKSGRGRGTSLKRGWGVICLYQDQAPIGWTLQHSGGTGLVIGDSFRWRAPVPCPVQCLAVAFSVPQLDVVAGLVHLNCCTRPVLPRLQLRAASDDRIPIPASLSQLLDDRPRAPSSLKSLPTSSKPH